MQECYFRTNWKYEFENFRFQLKKRKVFCIFFFIFIPLFLILDFMLVAHFLQTGDLVSAVIWIVYPILLIILNPIVTMWPKTYRVTFRGLEINGQLHRWKNFKGYEVTDDKLIIVNKMGGTLVLPRYFEDSVKEFLPKLNS